MSDHHKFEKLSTYRKITFSISIILLAIIFFESDTQKTLFFIKTKYSGDDYLLMIVTGVFLFLSFFDRILFKRCLPHNEKTIKEKRIVFIQEIQVLCAPIATILFSLALTAFDYKTFKLHLNQNFGIREFVLICVTVLVIKFSLTKASNLVDKLFK